MKNLSRDRSPIFGFTAGLILLFIFLPFKANAFSFLDVVINEIAWMGTSVSTADEWLELHNNTDFFIDVTGWKIETSDGSPNVELSGKIGPSGFFVIERTDDNTLPNISANQIYAGSLNNKGEYIKLLDKENNLIDMVDCDDGWFGGDNVSKKTMERKVSNGKGIPENWQTSLFEAGTPGEENSTLPYDEDVSGANAFSIGNFIITEVLPSPSGQDEEEEWIELLNQDTRQINLTGWKLTDQAGRTKTYSFEEKVSIESGTFIVLSRRQTGITLNNEGDGLYLMAPNGKIADRMDYGKAPMGKSYALIDGDWMWNSSPTPGGKNVNIPTEEGGVETNTFMEEEKVPHQPVRKEEVSPGQTGDKSNNSVFIKTLLAASLTSVISGAVFFVWKNFLKKAILET